MKTSGRSASMLLGCRSCHFCGVRHATTSQFYDTVIVGGGMVGNAMACALGLNPQFSSRRILLLEKGKNTPLPKSPPEQYSNRVSAVGPAAVHLFKNLGVWDRLQAHRVKRVNKLRVLDNCSTAELELDQPVKKQEVAYIIENNAIVGALYDKIRISCPTVEIKSEASVKSCRVSPSLFDVAHIELENGEQIETSLVVGADGSNSKVRQSMDVNYTAFGYNQSGVVATLVVETPGKNDVAWQRFSRAGPIAYLPLTSKLSSLVWTTSTDHANELLSLSKEKFVDELNNSMFTDEDQNDFVNKSLFLFSKMPFTSKRMGATALPPHVVALQGDTRAAFPLGFGHCHSLVLFYFESAEVDDTSER